MFSKLLLTKDGLIHSLSMEGEDKGAIEEKSVLRALNVSNFVLEEGFTLRSYFKIFKNYPILITLEDWVMEYIKEMENSPQVGCLDKEMPNAYIQLKKVAKIDRSRSRRVFLDENGEFDLSSEKIEKIDEKSFNTYFDVSMVDPDSEDETRYAIEFTALNKLLDVPIKISNKVSILKTATSSIGKVRLKKDEYDDKMGINLYEFMTEIIYEVSFLGPPDERESQKEDLQKRAEEVHSGDVKLISFEDFKKELSSKFNNK